MPLVALLRWSAPCAALVNAVLELLRILVNVIPGSGETPKLINISRIHDHLNPKSVLRLTRICKRQIYGNCVAKSASALLSGPLHCRATRPVGFNVVGFTEP